MPGRLYLKIFLSFIGIMAIAMFLVAGLFLRTQRKPFMDRFRQMSTAQVAMIRTLVEDGVRRGRTSADALDQLVERLAEAYSARVWITDASGDVLARSFTGPVPDPRPDDPDDLDDYMEWGADTGVTVIKCDDDPHCVYVSIPFGGNGVDSGVVHGMYRALGEQYHEERFFVGLAAICAAIALLVMPVSWLITRRLKRLVESALRIGGGDLSHRAAVRGRDEVAGVGRALNAMADSLSRMVRAGRELTANVSHELRTPLTRMRVAEEMLRKRPEDGRTDLLDSIREDIEALDALIGKLLDLSKLDLKDAPLGMESVDLAELAGAILDRIGPIARHRSVAVQAELPDSLVIRADGEALHTALTNIVENGARYADRDGVLAVTVRGEPGLAVVEVENTHPLMMEEELAAIFEPFHRARGTRAPGTGLGLAIARRIIERHGGSVSAENTPVGIRFVVELPAD